MVHLRFTLARLLREHRNLGWVASLGAALALATAIAWTGSHDVWTDAPPDVAEPDRPHVVLIMIDTLRADRLGSYGYERDTSPELDELAREGARFDRAVAQSSWTRPSIASFLTSQYPRTTGIYVEREQVLAERFLTLSEVLKENGYRTLGATANPNINSRFNFDQGFDHYADSKVVFRFMDRNEGQAKHAERPLPLANEMFDALLDRLDRETKAQAARPHYLQLNLMEVHEAHRPQWILRKPYRDLYSDLPKRERQYARAIRQVSRDTRAFVSQLTSRPGWRNSLVIILSDHGEGLLDHPHLKRSSHHGLLLYESQVFVPWMMYSPRDGLLPRGRVVEEPVRLLDLMPTVLDLVDIPGPKGMKGESLAPLVRREADSPLPDRFFVETQFREADKVGVYEGRWKYFHNRDRFHRLPTHELQALGVTEDGRRTDRSGEHPEVVERLREALSSWEEDHPKAEPTTAEHEISEAEAEQLRSLGYMQ